MTKLSAFIGNAQNIEITGLEKQDFYRAHLDIDIAKLRKLQTWGNAHLVTIDVHDGEKTARFIVSVGVDDNGSKIQGQLMVKYGATNTRERVSKWMRASWINFNARAEKVRARLSGATPVS